MAAPSTSVNADQRSLFDVLFPGVEQLAISVGGPKTARMTVSGQSIAAVWIKSPTKVTVIFNAFTHEDRTYASSAWVDDIIGAALQDKSVQLVLPTATRSIWDESAVQNSGNQHLSCNRKEDCPVLQRICKIAEEHGIPLQSLPDKLTPPDFFDSPGGMLVFTALDPEHPDAPPAVVHRQKNMKHLQDEGNNNLLGGNYSSETGFAYPLPPPPAPGEAKGEAEENKSDSE